MPKGRVSNPSIESIGTWYKHKSCTDYLAVGSRLDVTSTGHMLDTQRDGRRSIPANPPQPFDTKSQTEYKQISPFPFSDHDNRNSIQLKGEYLGDGRDTRVLGRRLTNECLNQHRSEINDFLTHHSRQPTNSFFHSNYMLSHDEKELSPVDNRRFPKKYRESSSGLIDLDTTTTKQFRVQSGSLPHRTPNQTLVSSIEPHLKKNTWTYAFHGHGKHTIYPKVWGDRCTTRLPHYKPRSRPAVVYKIPRHCSS